METLPCIKNGNSTDISRLQTQMMRMNGLKSSMAGMPLVNVWQQPLKHAWVYNHGRQESPTEPIRQPVASSVFHMTDSIILWVAQSHIHSGISRITWYCDMATHRTIINTCGTSNSVTKPLLSISILRTNKPWPGSRYVTYCHFFPISILLLRTSLHLYL